jgi:L-ascorbate metabolism protein UlaG (beta-lactamase superfamily)
MKIRYVSNAGIILSIEGINIGIDCFCRDSSKLYQDIPLEIRQEMKIDVLIFTHEHEDHFCAEFVKEAWEENKELQIVGNTKVIETLADIHIPASNLHEAREKDELHLGKVRIQFLESIHEGEQYFDVQNISLLINKEEKHYVVPGDAMPSREFFDKINAWSGKIDCFFVPFPYVGLHSTRKLLEEYFDIKNIFVLHQPRPEADTQDWVKNTKKVCQNASDGLPKPIFPEKLGERYKI